MEIKAKVVRLLPKETVGQYKKRFIHVLYADNPSYPQTLALEAFGTKSDIFDALGEGMEADFHINLQGREYTKDGETRVFNSIQCWKVENVTGTAAKIPVPQVSPAIEEDDLPF